jgi:hypothetical protein
LLNVGFIDDLVTIEQLNQIRRILCNRRKEALGGNYLFEIEKNNEEIVDKLADEFWKRLVSENRIDIGQKVEKSPTVRQRNMVCEESIRHPDVREMGGEWMSYQALMQLQLSDYLSNAGFSEEEVKLALTQIIARAVYPASELETSRWIGENSSVCDITGYPLEKITKDRLYKSSLKLYSIKDGIESFLSLKTNRLFDLDDRIIIYDLTNTYFEGRKKNSEIAKFGRSKEKRSDCKIVVLALVVNAEGFTKYSGIFEGNMQDVKTLQTIISNLRSKTSAERRATVVMDAGIATEDNLKWLAENQFAYICISRCKLKGYKIKENTKPIVVEDKKHQKITLQKIECKTHNDFFLKIDSEAKRAKEVSMNNRFQEGMEKGLELIKASLSKKRGTKTERKVFERLGRLKQKYPSVARFYDIDYIIETTTVTNKKTKKRLEERIVKSLSWKVGEKIEPNETGGTYFLRTSFDMSEELIWKSYNIIREIEYSFRTLKTDLDLRPVYHKKDASVMAHLHLGLLAYWVVNTVRYQLKNPKMPNSQTTVNTDTVSDIEPYNLSWKEIIRIMNTQKSVVTVSQNRFDEVIVSLRCSEPTPKVEEIYRRLNYKTKPFSKRKFVVHKSEFQKMNLTDLRKLMS